MKEPTDGEWGQKIRKIAAEGRSGITLENELEYFINDRKDDAKLNILPALKSGKVVVMDRYIHSNMAYQGALGLDVDTILEKNRQFPWPQAVFFLDITPEEGLARIAGREGGANEGYEKADFLKKVFDLFRQKEFHSMIRVDASKSIEDINAEIMEQVLGLVGN